MAEILHNISLCILGHLVRYTTHGHPSLMTTRYIDFLYRFRCKMYFWHERRSTMGLSSRRGVAAETRGEGVSTREGVVG
jgi:hypothetical protein